MESLRQSRAAFESQYSRVDKFETEFKQKYDKLEQLKSSKLQIKQNLKDVLESITIVELEIVDMMPEMIRRMTLQSMNDKLYQTE
jgi:hypothetical protein